MVNPWGQYQSKTEKNQQTPKYITSMYNVHSRDFFKLICYKMLKYAYWRDCLFSIVYSRLLCCRLKDHKWVDLFLNYPLPLIYVSVFVPVPYCFDYCNIVQDIFFYFCSTQHQQPVGSLVNELQQHISIFSKQGRTTKHCCCFFFFFLVAGTGAVTWFLLQREIHPLNFISLH